VPLTESVTRAIALAMTDHLIACGQAGATMDELAASAGRDPALAHAVLQIMVLGRQIAEARGDRFYIRLAQPRRRRSMAE